MNGPGGASPVGRPLLQLDGATRVTGRLRYAEDLELPGMLHAKVLRSDRPHARIASIDTTAAERLPGVRAVLSARNLRSLCADPYFGFAIRDQTPVALDRVRYVGEAVAAVAAVDADTAAEAVSLISVEYEDLPTVFDVERAIEPGATLLHEMAPRRVVPWRPDLVDPPALPNVVHRFALRKGDVEEGFAAAAHIVENTFVTPAAQHVAFESNTTVADTTRGGVTVWSPCQNPFSVQRQLAAMLGLPTGAVRVIVPAVGGGFGGRLVPRLEPMAALLSRAAGRPVRLANSREDDFAVAVQHPARIRLRSGVDADGRLLALDARILYESGAYADTTPNLIQRAYAATGPYCVPHVRAESLGVYTNTVPSGSFRGYGITQVCWAHEAQMDAIAAELGIDPLELRLRNVVDPGDAFGTGEPLPEMHYRELFRLAASRIGWHDGTYRRDGDRVRAKGIAAVIKGMATPTTSGAGLRLNRDGSLDVAVGTVDLGQGAPTALSQLAAEAVGVPVEMVAIRLSDTAAAPFDTTTAASRSTHSMGEALHAAGTNLHARLREIAAQELEASMDDLVVEDGRVFVRGSPEQGLTLADVVARSGQNVVAASGTFVGDRSPDGSLVALDPETGQGYGSAQWHPGVVACEVEVDLATGRVTPLRIHAVLYVGRVVNPVLAELQVHGSAIFALGQALFEEVVHGDAYEPVNRSFAEYLLPSMRDLPVELTSTLHEPVGETHVHGIGETALPPVRAAIANAASRAIGRTMTTLPLTPESVLRGLAGESPDGLPVGSGTAATLTVAG